MKMNNTARSITAAAVVGAAYAALTMLLAPISYGAIQVRVSEALCILPYFLPCTAWGAVCRLRDSKCSDGQHL